MHYRQLMFLHCLHVIEGERTIFGIYHILSGKKSSQTIQDAKVFGLLPYFNILPELPRDIIVEDTQVLKKLQMIEEVSANTVIVTPKGREALVDASSTTLLPHGLNGWKYGNAARLFWRRIALTTQVISHFLAGNRHYIPVENGLDVQVWVKKYVHFRKDHLEQLAQRLYEEIFRCLEITGSNFENEIFTMHLSGSHRYGYTLNQLAILKKMPEEEISVRFQGLLHRMLFLINNNIEEFPILFTFIKGELQEFSLTKSTSKTYELLRSGYSISEIAQLRNIKEATVEDHIVELALHVPTFSIAPFVPKEVEVRARSLIKAVKSKRLRDLKQVIGEDVSYFMLRLVLAKKEAENELT